MDVWRCAIVSITLFFCYYYYVSSRLPPLGREGLIHTSVVARTYMHFRYASHYPSRDTVHVLTIQYCSTHKAESFDTAGFKSAQ